MSRRPKRLRCAHCGKANPPHLSFGVGHPTRRTYCLDHIPWWVRLRMRIREAAERRRGRRVERRRVRALNLRLWHLHGCPVPWRCGCRAKIAKLRG